MIPANSAAKSHLRQQIRAQLAKISPAVRAVESIELCERLEPQLRSARRILFFAPLPDELDVWPLLEKLLAAGKICALPWYDAEQNAYGAKVVEDLAADIVPGRFGVREPAAGCAEMPLAEFDLVLVPGLAFDETGHRLGRGQGFYDRILAAAGGVKCGVAHNFQLLEKVPTEAHDARVNFIFTPARGMRRKES